MTSTPQASPNTHVARDLIQLAQVIVRLEERSLRDLELSYRQMRILKHVHAGVESATELGRRFGVTAPAISETLESLVRKGLLERQPHASDRRSVRLVLTDEGRDKYLQAQASEDEVGDEILEPLTDAQIAQLGELVELVLGPSENQMQARPSAAK